MRCLSFSSFVSRIIFLNTKCGRACQLYWRFSFIFLSLANPLMAGLTGHPAVRSSSRRDTASDAKHEVFLQLLKPHQGPDSLKPAVHRPCRASRRSGAQGRKLPTRGLLSAGNEIRGPVPIMSIAENQKNPVSDFLSSEDIVESIRVRSPRSATSAMSTRDPLIVDFAPCLHYNQIGLSPGLSGCQGSEGAE